MHAGSIIRFHVRKKERKKIHDVPSSLLVILLFCFATHLFLLRQAKNKEKKKSSFRIDSFKSKSLVFFLHYNAVTVLLLLLDATPRDALSLARATGSACALQVFQPLPGFGEVLRCKIYVNTIRAIQVPIPDKEGKRGRAYLPLANTNAWHPPCSLERRFRLP
jgi:hypothetical protein